LPQGKSHYFAPVLLQRRYIRRDLRHGTDQCLFFRMRLVSLDAFAAGRFMFGQRNALRKRCESALVCDDMTRVEFDSELVPRLTNFHAPPDPGNRN
jgi:hypothetical protein